VRSKALAAFIGLSAAAVETPTAAHGLLPPPQVAHCVDVGQLSLPGQIAIGPFEICVPV
jgi:hypothetical protein